MTSERPTVAGTGQSVKREAKAAGAEAAEQAAQGLHGATASLAIVFATCGYSQEEVLDAVRQRLPGALLVGCSAEGVIAHHTSHEHEHAVTVMAVASSQMRFAGYQIEGYSVDSKARAQELAAMISKDGTSDLVGVVLLPDGLTGDCTLLLSELQQLLGRNVGIVGGTSADAMEMKRTYQYCGTRIASDSVVALAIRGRGQLRFAVSHGCEPIGLDRVVTKADGSWVYSIDDLPAWQVLKEYLGEDTEDLNADGIAHVCLGEQTNEKAPGFDSPLIIRVPLKLDKENGALFFPGGGFTNGKRIRLTRRDPTRVRRSAENTAKLIASWGDGAKPALMLQFDCAGRGRVLFGTCVADEIVKPLQQQLGDNVPWVGFHTYGEIAPLEQQARYHNYTVVLAALYDA